MARTLSEADSKARLAPWGVPFADERSVHTAAAAVEAADELGHPVVVKVSGDTIAHKTERGLVRLGLGDAAAVERAAGELLAATSEDDGVVSLLVAPMLHATRELIVGMSVDPQFGPTVMVGIGGVLAEALADVAIRLVPIERRDADEMLDDLRLGAMLGPFRGEPAVDRDALADVLLALSRAASDDRDLRSVDLNPVLIVDGRPVAVDALVEVDDT